MWFWLDGIESCCVGWKAPVKASVSGVSLLQLSPFFASIFPLFPQKGLILRLMQEWICVKCPHTCHVEVDQFLNSQLQHTWPCWPCQRNSFWNSQTDSKMYTFPDQMNWQFVQILMVPKFHSKLRVLDTDDIKQKTSLFSAWYCFKAVVLLFYIVCVRYTK